MITILIAMLAGAAMEVEQLGWLAGCWEGKLGSTVVEEQWMKPAGGAMLGLGRNVAGVKTTMMEFLLISKREGVLTYSVQLRHGGPVTHFKLARASENEVVFENPEHDFPQRILYRREPDGSILARIEGKQKEKEMGVNFPMKRARCE